MTHYDMLMDSITNELFCKWKEGANGQQWNEENARDRAHWILYIVEQFQNNRIKLKEAETA